MNTNPRCYNCGAPAPDHPNRGAVVARDGLLECLAFVSEPAVHVRLTPYGANSPHHYWGTKTELDGVEIQEVSDIQMSFEPDALAKLHLTVNVRRPFEISVPAIVHIHYHVPEGCSLIETTTHGTDGREWLVIKTGVIK